MGAFIWRTFGLTVDFSMPKHSPFSIYFYVKKMLYILYMLYPWSFIIPTKYTEYIVKALGLCKWGLYSEAHLASIQGGLYSGF